MYRHVPASAPKNAPLVVALHGCTQTAADYAKVGWNELADKYGFYVAYAEQTTANNPLRCFNWAGVYGNPANLHRGQGENQSIKEMVDKMKADYSIDAKRVFVTGLSAGGAETALMLATWPDVFAAGAPIAGLPYDCAESLVDATTCTSSGKDMTASAWGDKVRAAFAGFAGPWPRVSVWQGTSDAVVNPTNEKELAKQWSSVHGSAEAPAASAKQGTVTHSTWVDAKGQVVVEMNAVEGMGHGVPIDPANGCGSAGSYVLDAKVCSTAKIADFFGLTGASPVGPGGDTNTPGGSQGGAQGGGREASGCAAGGRLSFDPSWALLALVVVVVRRRPRAAVVVAAAAALPHLTACSAPDPTAGVPVGSVSSALTLEKVANFGTNPGALEMYRYAPQNMPQNAPLVVAMHGCSATQDCSQAEAFSSDSGWAELADKGKFYVVFPRQTTANNPYCCFNWGGEYGDTANLQRGKGENQSIKEMVDKMKADVSVDPKRVFVAGFSAGGAEVPLMLATWPDLFAAGASFGGIPYDCAESVADSFNCMKPGKDQTASAWGGLVRKAYSGYSGPWPRLSIWQGSADTIVAPMNTTQLMRQWTDVHGVGQTPSATDTVLGYPHAVFKDQAGAVVVETYQITGKDHASFIDPSAGCGTAAQYFIDAKICGPFYAAKFFGIVIGDAADAGPSDGSATTEGGSSSSSSGSSGSSSGSSSGASGSGSSGTSGVGGSPDAGGDFGTKNYEGCGLAGCRVASTRTTLGAWAAAAALALACLRRITKRRERTR
jgi:poly(hydroxyalkanoate) depolymerase family esterase